jgi:hypothetical protein
MLVVVAVRIIPIERPAVALKSIANISSRPVL